jgi:3-oxoacyl-[acyl-carrier protein] reductase
MLRLEGKSALITGAGRGIGKAIAQKFLEEGARVVICDVVPERLEHTAHELNAVGPVHALAGDVSQAVFCDEMVRRTVEWYGELNVLVNNAGIAVFAPFLEHSEADWDRTMAVNLKSMFLLGQRAARVMIAQGKGGAIVNMASTNGLMGERDLVAYNASKGGVVLLTKTMAIELAAHHIRVNCVAPGLIRTELAPESGVDESFIQDYLQKIPLRRHGTPAEVASLFAYLASDEASFITGDAVVIDGGQIAEE